MFTLKFETMKARAKAKSATATATLAAAGALTNPSDQMERERAMSKLQSLPIIFRKHYYQDTGCWEITAFFPTEFSDVSSWYSMTCYAHVGQHGSAALIFFHRGKKCKPEEYADLLAELRGIYEEDEDAVSLVVRQKETRQYRAKREANWRAYMRKTA